MKQYLYVTITNVDGFQFPNPLKLSETYLITKMLKNKQVESVKVELMEVTKEVYKSLFN